MHSHALAEVEQRAAAIAAALRSSVTREPAEPRAAVPEASANELESVLPGIDYARTLKFFRWYDGLLQAHRAIAGAIAEENASLAAVSGREAALDPQLTATLAAAHRLLLQHPAAAKSTFSALVAQGREYARSAPGRALRERFTCSPQVRKAALLWRSLSQGMLSEQEQGELPEAYLDNLLRAVDRPDLVALLSQLVQAHGHKP